MRARSHLARGFLVPAGAHGAWYVNADHDSVLSFSHWRDVSNGLSALGGSSSTVLKTQSEEPAQSSYS
jgi:hypothetical protein